MNFFFMHYKLKSMSFSMIFLILMYFTKITSQTWEHKMYFLEYKLQNFLNYDIKFNFLVDLKSLIFFFTVTIISLSVIYYSICYMQEEKFFFQFYLLLLSFIFSMLLFIFSADMMGVILGWDGLGVTSFLLVIYYSNSNSLNSGLITIWTNRMGDVGLMFMVFIYLKYSFWDMSIMFMGLNFNNISISDVFIIFLSASTKSAQIPFSAWLPAAMAAPTPVSSLVHSSTLVTAGIFLLLRFEMVFYYSKFIFFIGGMTSIFSSLSAVFEPDMKKVVALSTLSHLGIMVSMMKVDSMLSFSHLIFHAFFKALLFLTMGLMIHLSLNYQDSRKVKNLMSMSWLNSSIQVISLMSLCGTPFLTGYYSKDFFLEVIMMGESNIIFLSVSMSICLLSFFYTLKLIMNIIKKNFTILNLFWVMKNQFLYFKSMSLLILLSLTGGTFFTNYLFTNFNLIFISLKVKLLIYMLIFFFIMFGLILNLANLKFIFLLKMLNLVILSRDFNHLKKIASNSIVLSKTFIGGIGIYFFKNKIIMLNFISNKIMMMYYPFVITFFLLNF